MRRTTNISPFQLINYSLSELGHIRFSWFIDQRSEIMDSNIKKEERSEKEEKVGRGNGGLNVIRNV